MSKVIFNRKVKSPCLNCPERELACSDRCEKYKEYKEKLREVKNQVAKDKNYELKAYCRDGRSKKLHNSNIWKRGIQ